MGLTLVQRFGSGAIVDSSTPSDPKLIISLSALKNTADGGDITGDQGLDGVINSGNANAFADRIFASLFLLSAQNQPATNNADDIGVYIENPRKTFVNRDIQEQIEISYITNFYIASTGTTLDPDNVVS